MAAKTQSPSPPEEFWIPPEFLTDAFPSEFPYEFDSSNNTSSAESDSSSSDEDDFFAALSRRFSAVPKPKPEWTVAGSPQSTLSGTGVWSADGSPNGPSQVASPPVTPFSGDRDTWELIYAAAGQVARLKMASPSQHHHLLLPKFAQPPPATNPQFAGRGLLTNPNPNPNTTALRTNSFAQLGGGVKPPGPAQQFARQRQMGQYYQIQAQAQNRVRSCGGGGVCVYENVGRTPNLSQSGWPPLSRPGTGSGLVNGSGVKRECAGTGVFLPRRFPNPLEPRKKPTGCPNVVLPAKVVQALNLSFEDMNLAGHSQPRFGCGFAPDHGEEALMARRNALLEQQRRSLVRTEGALNHEIRLPQEWTY